MKKNFSSRALSVFCFIATLAIGCSSDSPATPASCNNDVSAFETALTAYTGDPTNTDKCLAVIAAAQKVLDCPGVTAAQRSEFQGLLDATDCQ
ncbi:MAG: hypothetical protein OEV74_03785 [Cyclobacteriaceae bacterium]|nr:hypothetical protein [Cyclobacteriaceae bacterium]MDH4295377.1 hypothetical protein [Cyclobacteriaceae bacterium]MDH5249633.1 hypothetical protein [Cyclobacteriaceae bacterium]